MGVGSYEVETAKVATFGDGGDVLELCQSYLIFFSFSEHTAAILNFYERVEMLVGTEFKFMNFALRASIHVP